MTVPVDSPALRRGCRLIVEALEAGLGPESLAGNPAVEIARRALVAIAKKAGA